MRSGELLAVFVNDLATVESFSFIDISVWSFIDDGSCMYKLAKVIQLCYFLRKGRLVPKQETVISPRSSVIAWRISLQPQTKSNCVLHFAQKNRISRWHLHGLKVFCVFLNSSVCAVPLVSCRTICYHKSAALNVIANDLKWIYHLIR